MATAAQVAANRVNSQNSTGPTSPDGKAASALNRLKHGFRSATVLLPGDNTAEYEALLLELGEHFQPRDLSETRLIREMADAEWRLRRVRGHMERAISRHIASLAKRHPWLDPLDLQAFATETLHQTGCSHGTWLRYETKFERQYDRAFAVLSRIGFERAKRLVGRPVPCPAAASQATPPSNENPAISRGAPCPCGSGDKYKRCCGRNAPPVLHLPGLKAAA